MDEIAINDYKKELCDIIMSIEDLQTVGILIGFVKEFIQKE